MHGSCAPRLLSGRSTKARTLFNPQTVCLLSPSLSLSLCVCSFLFSLRQDDGGCLDESEKSVTQRQEKRRQRPRHPDRVGGAAHAVGWARGFAVRAHTEGMYGEEKGADEAQRIHMASALGSYRSLSHSSLAHLMPSIGRRDFNTIMEMKRQRLPAMAAAALTLLACASAPFAAAQQAPDPAATSMSGVSFSCRFGARPMHLFNLVTSPIGRIDGPERVRVFVGAVHTRAYIQNRTCWDLRAGP